MAKATVGDLGASLPPTKAELPALGEHVDRQESNVVSGPLVFLAWIPEPDDENVTHWPTTTDAIVARSPFAPVPFTTSRVDVGWW